MAKKRKKSKERNNKVIVVDVTKNKTRKIRILDFDEKKSEPKNDKTNINQ